MHSGTTKPFCNFRWQSMISNICPYQHKQNPFKTQSAGKYWQSKLYAHSHVHIFKQNHILLSNRLSSSPVLPQLLAAKDPNQRLETGHSPNIRQWHDPGPRHGGGGSTWECSLFPYHFKGTTLHIPSFKMLQLEDSWWIPGTEGVLIPLAQCKAYIPWAVVCSSFRPHCARRYSSYDPGILVHIHPIRVSAFQIRFSRPMGCKVRGVCYNLNISLPHVN